MHPTLGSTLQLRTARGAPAAARAFVTGLVVAVLCAALPCAAGDAYAAAPAPAPADAQRAANAQRLAAIFDAWFERNLELNPTYATLLGDPRYNDRLPNSLGEAQLAAELAAEREFQARLREVDPALLSAQDRLSYEVFARERALAIEGFRFQSELLPINQIGGLHQLMAQFGSGTGAQPFATVKDYDAWLSRIDGFVVWLDQAIANMKRGADKGITQPRVLMEKVIPQFDRLIAKDPEQSVFWKPVASFPKAIPAPEQARLRAAYRTAILEKLNPALTRVRDYVANDYLQRARTSIAFTDLPLGREWYAYRVKVQTTTDLTPERIHQIGLDEVKRIGAEIDRVSRELGWSGDRKAFFDSLRADPRFYYTDENEVLEGYRALKERVRARLPEQFDVAPKADFEIRAVEPFRAASAASASYQPSSPDGRRPGVFYVNTFDLKSRPRYAMQAIYLHEAEPGHHFQIAIQQELQSLPKFRRYGGETAYFEGWGLYAESLGRELGLYTDPYDYVGALSTEIWRAVRLVTDTGMHAKGWTRQQALDYMLANTAIGATDAAAEIDRYIAWPGQALAYKIGELQIKQLKARAQRELGDRYDVKAFHREILADGALPLEVLAAKIDRWIARVKAGG